MKPLTLRRLSLHAFWFIALLLGVFVLIERVQFDTERDLLAKRSFTPDTASQQRILFAEVPDTMSFAGEDLSVSEPFLRTDLRQKYYRWVLSPAEMVGLLQRGYSWGHWVRDALWRAQLPEDFYYVVAQRSYLELHTGGWWQISAQYATQHGLRVDEQVDERFDIFLSTLAIAHELKELYRKKGSWVAVLRAFCKEDQNCVAEVLVLSQVLATPERYGYNVPIRHRNPPIKYCVEQVQVLYPEIRTFLQQKKVDSTVFAAYNPFLLDFSGPLQQNQQVYLPLDVP